MSTHRHNQPGRQEREYPIEGCNRKILLYTQTGEARNIRKIQIGRFGS